MIVPLDYRIEMCTVVSVGLVNHKYMVYDRSELGS